MAAEKTKPAKDAAKAAPKKIKARKKDKKNVAFGHAYIKSTFNNTIVSITDPAGGVIAWWLLPQLYQCIEQPISQALK